MPSGTGSQSVILPSLAVAVLLSACSTQVDVEPLEASSEVLVSDQRYRSEYLLQPGDLVDVSVYQYPEFSRRGMIRPDGMLTLPVIDDVKAQGLSPGALDELVTEQLAERILSPEVTVYVENIQEPMVYVLGEVGSTMAIPLRQASTVSQALTLAAGLRYSSAVQSVAIIRLESDGLLRAIPLEREFGKSKAAYFMAMRNTPLLSGDLVYVPENNRSRFTRAIQDFITTPLTALNQILAPYLQIELIEQLEDQ